MPGPLFVCRKGSVIRMFLAGLVVGLSFGLVAGGILAAWSMETCYDSAWHV